MPRFADIRGQARALEQIRLALARDRLPHAYLFHGTRGVGKTETAFALAQVLNCERPADGGDACGACRPCRNLARLHHPDLHWIFPMPGSEKGKPLKGDRRAGHVQETIETRLAPGIHGLSFPRAASIAIGRDDDSRVGSVGELRQQAGYAPMEARVKVFVVSEADRMTREAANSLLKVLEEPPPENLLVLTTSRPGDLPDTIVSRCQSVRFRDLSEEEIVDLIGERGLWQPPRRRGKEWERAEVAPEAPALAAALSRGSLTRAVELLEEENVVARRDQALEFLRLRSGDPDLAGAIRELEKSASAEGGKAAPGEDRRVVERVLDFGLLWLGDLLRAATGSDLPPANRDREAEVRALARGLRTADIHRMIAVLEEARAALRGNVYRPLVLYPVVLGLEGMTPAEEAR